VRIWTEGVPLDEAFRAHRAMQLGQEAPQAPEPPPVNPESLPPRSKSGELEHRAPLPPSEATPRKRGPHAERLAKARAAQEAATRPKPAPEGVNRGPKVVKPKDPFDVEEDG
jgi:hypothetical protein